jgi:hypothetical protein
VGPCCDHQTDTNCLGTQPSSGLNEAPVVLQHTVPLSTYWLLDCRHRKRKHLSITRCRLSLSPLCVCLSGCLRLHTKTELIKVVVALAVLATELATKDVHLVVVHAHAMPITPFDKRPSCFKTCPSIGCYMCNTHVNNYHYSLSLSLSLFVSL